MAVSFINTTEHWSSNTARGSNVNVPIPTANVGDTLLLLGFSDIVSGLTGSDTGYPTFTTIRSDTTTAANGTSFAGFKIVDGTEGSIARLKFSTGGITGNISTVIMRLTGAHKIKPWLGTGSLSINTASDGVATSTANGTSTLFHPGGMTIAYFGSISTAAGFDLGDEPAGTTIVSANQANVFFGVVYRENPTDIANHGRLAWNITAGNKKASVIHILPDVSWIGVKSNSHGTATSISNTFTHRLMNDGRATYKALPLDEIYEFGFKTGNSVGGGNDRIQLGVYDITSGTKNAIQVANATFSSLNPSGFTTVSITPVALVSGNTYALAVRCNTTTSLTTYINYVSTPFANNSTQNGSFALPSSWDFGTTTNDNRLIAWAGVRTYSEPEPVLADVDGDETVLAGQQNVIVAGSSLLGTAYFKISSGSRNINCTIDSATNETLQIDIPSLNDLVTANIKFGSIFYRANTSSNLGIGISGTLNPPLTHKIHNVTDVDRASQEGCIYYGLSPPVAIGDQIVYSNTSFLGHEVLIDIQGFPTINTSSDVTDAFTYRIFDTTDETWGSEAAFVSLGSTNPAAVSSAFRVVKSSDGNRYSEYPNGRFTPFLMPDHWIFAKMPMRIVHPTTSTTSTYIYENAYPGLQYNLPVCVQGGAWPFIYELTTAPTGMTIGSTYGSVNYGRLVWTNPAVGNHTVAVKVTDQDGNIVTKSWTLVVDTSKYVFFDAVNGNDSTGTGAIGSPYKTFAKFSGLATTPELNGKICVYRSGTYATDNAALLTDSGWRWFMGPNKPLVHMAYPGESVIFDFNECNWNWEQYSGTEVAIIGVEMRGINNTINDSQGTYFRLTNSNRTLFDSINFTQQATLTASPPTNPACIGFRESSATTDLAITNCIFDGLDKVFAVQLYNSQYVLFENNILKNLVSLGAFYAKLGFVYDITCRNNIAIENNLTEIFIQDGYNSVDRMEICWNNIKTDSTQAILYGPNPPGGIGKVGWLYRNTIQMGAADPAVHLDTVGISVTIENNIFMHDGTYSNGIRQSAYTGSLTQINQLSAPNITYANSTGALTGIYRTSYLGTHGYEVA